MTKYLPSLYLALAAIATKTRKKKLCDKILPVTELQMRKFSHSLDFELHFCQLLQHFLHKAQGQILRSDVQVIYWALFGWIAKRLILWNFWLLLTPSISLKSSIYPRYHFSFNTITVHVLGTFKSEHWPIISPHSSCGEIFCELSHTSHWLALYQACLQEILDLLYFDPSLLQHRP